MSAITAVLFFSEKNLIPPYLSYQACDESRA